MFYTFGQNNSGGSFVFDKKAGITHFVIVEAANAPCANNRAEEIGLYFDGDGDCPCCGNRWHETDDDGDPVPSIYSTPLDKYEAFALWMKPNPEAVIHYLDGRIEWVELKAKA